jgi:hypothetical protein
MAACCENDDYLPIVKMLLNHPKIQVNEREEVIITESISWFHFVFLNFIDFLYCRKVGQHCIMHLIMVMC